MLPFPFHFLNNNHAMNVRPKHYTWPAFYDGLIRVTRHSFSLKAIARRVPATATAIPKWMNVVRAMSSEGWGRIEYHTTIRRQLDRDHSVRRYLDGETNALPAFYHNRIKRDLGPLYRYLPEGALYHDPNAYLGSTARSAAPEPVRLRAARPRELA